MAVTEQERGMIEDLRVKGYSSAQIGSVIKELRRRDEDALAQAEWDKKHAEEKARIEAERKKVKEEEATETALKKPFTFQTGVEPEEEVEPIGILAPEVEKTAKEKNTELVDQNAAENDKRQGTDFDTWYTDIFLKKQKTY